MSEAENSKSGEKNLSGKYLTFHLDTEGYGIDILNVQEIIQMVTVTSMPRNPDFIRGVINLRDHVIPVIDLRKKLGFTALKETGETCIVVVEMHCGSKSISLGLLIDSVDEVLAINHSEIHPPPSLGAMIDVTFMKGIATINDSVKILLDIDKILDSNELSKLAEAL